MTFGLRPYPAYKDSAMGWLGKMPEHWEATMVKWHYTIRLGKMLQNESSSPGDVEVPYLKAQHVQWFSVHTTDAPKMWANPKDVDRFGVVSGDLLVCEGGEGGRCGILRQQVEKLIIQNALHRVRPRAESRNDFLQYVMNSVAAIGWFDILNDKATIAHFTREKFGALKVPIPPLSEQTAIACYLDYIGHRINRYIQAKQKLITLLEEQKQAIIQDAVIGRIDVRTGKPYAACKDSGVEWLGKVPEHWAVRKIKHWLSINQLTLSEETDPEYIFDYLDIGSIDAGHLVSSPNRISFKSAPSRARRIVREGDTIMSTVRTYLKAVWHVEQIGFDLIASTGFAVFTPESGTWPKFLQYLCQSQYFTDQITSRSIGIAYPAIPDIKLRVIETLVPPLSEQTAIARHLDEKTSQIDKAIARTQREVELLHEYHQLLISDVVTGKLDVREAAADLPTEEGDCDSVDPSDNLPDDKMPHDGIEPDTSGAML